MGLKNLRMAYPPIFDCKNTFETFKETWIAVENAILDKYMVLPFAFKRDTRNHRHQPLHVFLSIYTKFTIWFE